MKKVNCTVTKNVCTLRQFQVGIHLYRLKQILDARRERDCESTVRAAVDPSGISAGISKCELLNLLYCLSHRRRRNEQLLSSAQIFYTFFFQTRGSLVSHSFPLPSLLHKYTQPPIMPSLPEQPTPYGISVYLHLMLVKLTLNSILISIKSN